MHFSLKTIEEKYRKLFPSSPKEDRSFEGPTIQSEEQAKIDSVSDAYTKWLCDFWKILRNQTYHQIKVEDLEAFGIRYEKLELDAGVDGPLQPLDENTFFLPNFAKVKDLEYSPNQWNIEQFKIILGEWDVISKSECYRGVRRLNATWLSTVLSFAFDGMEWKGNENEKPRCLQGQTDWIPSYVANPPS